MNPAGESERERKARELKAHERAARKAEIAEAIAATDEITRRAREASDRERIAAYEKARLNGPLDLARLAILPLILFVVLLLIVERQVIEHRVADCFNAKSSHNYGCAQTLAHSMWAWLLPRELAEELKAAQEFRE